MILLLLSLLAVDPNFIVILMDDIGTDRVGIYNEHPDPGKTPNIDRFYSEGLRFNWAYTNNSCSPTRAAFLTGLYSYLNGMGRAVINFGTPSPDFQHTEFTTIGDFLSAIRYETHAVGKWHLESTDTLAPLQSGFDTHQGPMAVIEDYFAYTKTVNGVSAQSTLYVTTEQIDDVLTAISAAQGPFFIYLALSAPHAPWNKPPAHLHTLPVPLDPESDIPATFKAQAEAMDTELGRLFDFIDFDTTYVFLMGDNGTPKPAVTSPHDPNHAKGTLYQGGIRVPFGVRGPSVRSGQENNIIQSVDIFATIAELVGEPSPPDLTSFSFAPYLFDANFCAQRQWVLLEHYKPNGAGPHFFIKEAAVNSKRKLFRVVLPPPFTEEMYDVVNDPFELNNLLDVPLSPSDLVHYNRLAHVLDTRGVDS